MTGVNRADRGQLVNDHLGLGPRDRVRYLTGVQCVRDHRHHTQTRQPTAL